jgi:DNA-binding MarR family transcriptional regulator
MRAPPSLNDSGDTHTFPCFCYKRTAPKSFNTKVETPFLPLPKNSSYEGERHFLAVKPLSAGPNQLLEKLLGQDSVLLNTHRIAIMLELYYASALDFPQLRRDLETTDGGLARYLKVLADEGLVQANREMVDSRWRTTYMITQKGITSVEEMLETLSEINRELKK